MPDHYNEKEYKFKTPTKSGKTSQKMEDMEEETVIIPRKVLNTMQDKLEETERENEEIAKRTKLKP